MSLINKSKAFLAWLATIAPQITDPAKLWITPIGDDPKTGNPPEQLILPWQHPGAPIRGDVTAAYIPPQDSFGGQDYGVLPMFIYNPNNPNGKSEPVITLVKDVGGPGWEGEFGKGLKKWESNKPPYGFYTMNDSKYLLVAEASSRHPDVQQRIEDFITTGDPPFISSPGIIFHGTFFMKAQQGF